MLLLGLDLETTGLNIETDDIIEIGCVLWDTDDNKPIRILNEIIVTDIEISPDIERLTGITNKINRVYGKKFERVLGELVHLWLMSDYIVAHNGNVFDKPFLKNYLIKNDMIFECFDEIDWIDTMIDVDFPYATRKLWHLAAEHGFLNPFAHRAVFDVLTMLKILSNYDIDNVIENMKAEKITIQAICKKPWEDDGVSTTQAKENGFRWNGSIWCKTIRDYHLQDEEIKSSNLEYKVKEVINY